MIAAGYDAADALDSAGDAFEDFAEGADHMTCEQYMAYLARSMLLRVDSHTGRLACVQGDKRITFDSVLTKAVSEMERLPSSTKLSRSSVLLSM